MSRAITMVLVLLTTALAIKGADTATSKLPLSALNISSLSSLLSPPLSFVLSPFLPPYLSIFLLFSLHSPSLSSFMFFSSTSPFFPLLSSFFSSFLYSYSVTWSFRHTSYSSSYCFQIFVSFCLLPSSSIPFPIDPSLLDFHALIRSDPATSLISIYINHHSTASALSPRTEYFMSNFWLIQNTFFCLFVCSIV